MDKSPDAFRTISEVAELLETPAHVLRFWESRFPQIKPVKRAGGRRYYRPSDVALLVGIKRLLHDEGMTIRGVQKVLREQGIRHVSGLNEPSGDDEVALEAALSALEGSDGPGTGMVPPKAATAQVRTLQPALDLPEPEKPARLVLSAEASVPPTPVAAAGPAEIAGPDDQPEAEDLAEHVSDDSTVQGPSGPIAWPNAPPDQPVDPAPMVQRPLPGDAMPDAVAPAEPVAAAGVSTPTDGTAGAPALTESALDAAPADAAAPTVHAATPPLPDRTLAAHLRAMPPGALADRREALEPLIARLTALRDAMVLASRSGRR